MQPFPEERVMTDAVKVEAFDNGPFKVSGAKSLRLFGKEQPVEGDVFLCRCGQSANAPFCDGTHSKVDFDGSNQGGEKKALRVWEGKRLKTYFNSNICMHAAYCKPLGALRKKELDDETSATAEEIIAVVESCPSRALTWEAKDALEPTPQGTGADLDIQEGGEIRVQCAFEAVNFDLEERQDGARATLCRCGLSKNKPYCDASHAKAEGFR